MFDRLRTLVVVLILALPGIAQAWQPPDPDSLPQDDWGRTVRLGRDLIVDTQHRIGPLAADPARRFAGNALACESCHLGAGTKEYALPLVGVLADFPQYRAREGHVGTIEERVNGCLARSMNGRPLPVDSAEMTAIVAYMKFLSNGVPIGTVIKGRGPGTMPYLSRAANPAHGAEVYAQVCAACHGANGAGVADISPLPPPLWGPNSFNDGAGMNRLISAANFIHNNMPFGTSWENPVLSEADAWDVAAFVQSQPRPHYDGLEHDFPVLKQKPVDAGYGPYADAFRQEQHRLGPFKPIEDAKRPATATLRD